MSVLYRAGEMDILRETAESDYMINVRDHYFGMINLEI